MGFFGSTEKRARESAAEAESRRLVALPRPDLATALMPAFGPDGIAAKSGHRRGPLEVTEWLFADTSTKARYRQPVLGPVLEALALLESVGLLERRSFGGVNSTASTYHATRLGIEALGDGSVSVRVADREATASSRATRPPAATGLARHGDGSNGEGAREALLNRQFDNAKEDD